MQCLIFVCTLVVVASAAVVEKDAKKKEEKKNEGLVWPLPDPSSEGDLMLHGNINYDRVRALHNKSKVDDDIDKMMLARGRLFLRRVVKFFDENAEFKIPAALCKDTRNLNTTINRWRIEIPKLESPQRDSPIPKDKGEKQADAKVIEKPDESKNITELPKNVTEAPSNATESPSNATEASLNVTESTRNVTESPHNVTQGKNETRATTPLPVSSPKKDAPVPEKETYEIRRRDFYRHVGTNFARLLLKEQRKEKLVAEESEYLERWLSNEAVHYGALAIYCNEGENIKEIKKVLASLLDEKSA